MYCRSCIYWEDDICYKKGKRVKQNNNICDSFVREYKMESNIDMDLVK